METGAKAKPAWFGKLLNFAKAFYFTDVFTKRATASGRGKAKDYGLETRSSNERPLFPLAIT